MSMSNLSATLGHVRLFLMVSLVKFYRLINTNASKKGEFNEV